MDTPRHQAAKEGKTRYHGKPCRICGETEKLTSTSACVACARKHAKRLRTKIREMLAQAKAEVAG
jgi:hypothetical protein